MFTVRMVAMLLALNVSASSAQSLTGADVSLPGAEARLGWGGGYSSGAWSLLHLRVVGGDAYRLNLQTQTGTLRAGLQPLTATLEVSAGAGVREQRLWLPLFTKRPVKLTLTSSLGRRSATINPLGANALVSEPMDSPAAYLAQPRFTGILEPQSALTALAGGALLTDASGLERLPNGRLGLGELRRDPALHSERPPPLAALDLETIAEVVARVAQPPARASEGLAWWCAAAFVAVLGVYSARRLEARFAVWSAGLMLGIGVVGWVALRAGNDRATTPDQTVLIGAGGWGLQIRVSSRFNATATRLSLPSGVQLLSPSKLSPSARHYTLSATLLNAGAWSSLSYWSAPIAARVPLRVSDGELENSGTEPLTDVYVVGTGTIEPISAAAKRSFKTTDDRGFDSGYSGYGSLVRHLPSGSAVARRGDTLVIALPELGGTR